MLQKKRLFANRGICTAPCSSTLLTFNNFLSATDNEPEVVPLEVPGVALMSLFGLANTPCRGSHCK